MRIYGSIQTKFWTHNEIHRLSDQAKLLANYLLCSPHTNMLGCFRIPTGYVAEDLNWNLETVKSAFDELVKINFITYDTTNAWVMINNFLKYHPIENPNQGKSIIKIFDEVPKAAIFISQLIKQLIEYAKNLTEEFICHLETLIKPFLNQEKDQDQKKNQEQKKEVIMSGKPDVDSLCNDHFFVITKQPPQNHPASLKTEAIEVLQFLNNKTGRAYRPVDINLKLIMARLKSGATVMDCRQVIAKKTREWKGDVKMAEYLRPATLFNAVKFEQYMGELVIPKEELQSESA